MSEIIAAKIRELRLAKGWSKGELGKRLGEKGNPRTAVHRWEGLKKTPTLTNVERLAKAFGCEVVDIDPLGEALTPETRRAGRLRKRHVPPYQLHEAAPPLSTTGVAMVPGDQGFVFLQGVWLILTPLLREQLVEHARTLARRSLDSGRRAKKSGALTSPATHARDSRVIDGGQRFADGSRTLRHQNGNGNGRGAS